MRRQSIIQMGIFFGGIPLIPIIFFSIDMSHNPYNSIDGFLETKKYEQYNCSGNPYISQFDANYPCFSTVYEIKYTVRLLDGSIKQVYGGKDQKCMCHFFADLYYDLPLPEGLYPLINDNLNEYNMMIINKKYTFYTDIDDNIFRYNKGFTRNALIILLTVFVSFTILIVLSVLLKLYKYDGYDNNNGKCIKRPEYIPIADIN